jgi:hypothetical protein
MMVLHLVEEGLFGDLTYAEGAYIHDCRGLMFTPSGELTWRGASRTVRGVGNGYPTHSLGPVAWWLGIGRRDHLTTTATFVTRSEGAWRYVRERFGPDHPLASADAMPVGDSATTVITTENGAVIVLRVDTNSARPHNMVHYALQGTRGAYLSERRHGESPLVWLHGVSPGDSPSGAAEWQDLWHLADAHEHPRWRAEGSDASSAGHGGGDYFVIRDFVDSTRTGANPPVDVYDSVTWSSIVPLSADSVARGGAPVEVPRFRRGTGLPPSAGHG